MPIKLDELEYYNVSDFQSGKRQVDVLKDKIGDKNIEVNSLIERRDKLKNVQENNDKIVTFNGNITKAEKDLDSMRNELLSLNDYYKAIKGQIHDIDHYETIFKPVSEMLRVTDVWALPTSMLSIFLALSMGGLGSLIFVTIEYLNCNPKECAGTDIGMYFFRPILGSLMALVMYIVVKSGQISFFGEDVTELSPFLLSFLGVASGLASETLYERLSESIEAKVKLNGV